MPARISVDDVEPDKPKNAPIAEPSVKKVTFSEPDTSPVAATDPAPGHEGHTQVDEELEAKSGHTVVSAFCAFPKSVSFSGEETGEDIILFMRQHVIINVPWIILTLILLIAPLAILPILLSFGALPSLGLGVNLVLFVGWYLGIFTYAFLNFLYWYFNVYIVTNERIIDVDWYSVVNHDTKFTQIAKIEDVSASQFGVIPGLFDFGNVKIETAGTEPNLAFEKIPHPQLVAKKIQELMQIEENEGDN